MSDTRQPYKSCRCDCSSCKFVHCMCDCHEPRLAQLGMKKDDSVLDLGPLEQRAEGIRDWLTQNGRECFTEQKHTRGLNQEKIYWHYGYLAALTDALNFLLREVK